MTVGEMNGWTLADQMSKRAEVTSFAMTDVATFWFFFWRVRGCWLLTNLEYRMISPLLGKTKSLNSVNWWFKEDTSKFFDDPPLPRLDFLGGIKGIEI